ncbi:MAG TPA: DUF885 domain-containing protein [Stellaceae bacterium]|nr:DUF885 domain-containing protein [Stellaceae bacterium]
MTSTFRALGLAIAMLAADPVMAAPVDDLHAILKDYDRYTDEADPIEAGQHGNLAAARLWPDDSPAAVQARRKQLESFRDRLKAIPAGALSGEDALNRDLLADRVALDLDGFRFDEERIPFTSDEGFFVTPAYMAEATQLVDKAQVDAYLARLAAFPAYYDRELANLRRGIETGWTQPRITALAASKTTRAAADLPPEQSALMEPLDKLPTTMPDAASLKAQGLEIIRTKVKPAEVKVAEFFEHEYLPKARETIGASALPQGREYYAYRVRRETTTDLTPDQIFDLGNSEIARIRKAMDAIIAETGFKGSFKDFQAFLRTDKQFYVTTREALMEKASRLAKRVDDKLPQYFGKLPRLTYGVREVPRAIEEGYTSARYNPGSPEQGIAGGLMINTSHLDQRPLYELPALVAHEGVPGHHLQIALAQEQQGVPLFRRRDDITAFVEGWALYSEQLAGEIGLYSTPYERFGLLSMEMWRACRLVIDTGIHWKGWTRDQGVACLKDNSALADKNIQNEVDRYIAWPGQALGYKIGELKIMELRNRAQAALGPKFDYRSFHDAVIDEGVMPLNLLERRIDKWIAEKRG